MKNNKRPLIIGITGGTGSGKSTVCKAIIDNIHSYIRTRCILQRSISFDF